MMKDNSELFKAADRVIAFLETCGEIDIESGIGDILGLGTPIEIEDFKAKIRAAIQGPTSQMENHKV